MAPPAHAEPLAVIGLACRFPQDATNIETLWQCLLAGRSMATRIPEEKINTNGFYHPDPEHGGSIYMDVGHFLVDSTAPFDPPFFNLSKNDIVAMDPQQRLVLENTYHALENGL
jgi:acyl transferase domain-containing protein